MNTKTGILVPKKLIAVASIMMCSSAFATTISFDDTSIGGDNTFDFDGLTLASYNATVAQTDTNGDGTLNGPDDFTEIGATGVTNFINEDGTTQTIISPSTTGINVEYELLFDLSLAGSATFTPFDFDNADSDNDNTTGIDQVNGVISFDNLASTLDLYYDTTLGGGIDGGTSTLLGSISLTGSNKCSTVNIIDSSQTFGSCLLSGDFTPVAGFFAEASSGTDLTALPPGKPVSMNFDINIAGFDPELEYVYPGGPGSTQTIEVQHDGSARIVVPEPNALALLGLGLIGLATARRRKA